jgi:hypothetical protein
MRIHLGACLLCFATVGCGFPRETRMEPIVPAAAAPCPPDRGDAECKPAATPAATAGRPS